MNSNNSIHQSECNETTIGVEFHIKVNDDIQSKIKLRKCKIKCENTQALLLLQIHKYSRNINTSFGFTCKSPVR